MAEKARESGETERDGGGAHVSPLLRMRRVPARCEGRGYFLVEPSDPSNWDVPLVRRNCHGCPDCLALTTPTTEDGDE